MGKSQDQDVARAAEQAAQHSYSRLVAYLSSRTGDLAAAEDALADAFQRALQTWRRSGVPDNPEAWLLVVARNRLIDGGRKFTVQKNAEPTIRLIQEEAEMEKNQDQAFPDDRLKLLFVCAHPAIDVAIRTPLMLQTVLGVQADRIASAFLVSPPTMGQRLVRAKNKIRGAKISFEVPCRDQLKVRLQAVLETIYAAYGTGWNDLTGCASQGQDLTEEALWLARLVIDLLPDQPEARGLLALMLYCESRQAARRSTDNTYIPLSEQNISLWSEPMIIEAEQLLAAALRESGIGPFQLEASIQSAHCMRLATGRNNWCDIIQIYDRLAQLAPTAGVLIGRAAALGEGEGPQQGLTALQNIDLKSIRNYQPFWAVKADILAKSGQLREADQAYQKAIDLSEDKAICAYLQLKRQHAYGS